MNTSPDAVYVIIPAMKELGMSWTEIKRIPRYELVGLIKAHQNYELLHSFDGYSASEVADMAKNKPEVRSAYNKYLEINAKYKDRSGRREKQSLSGLIKN
jgi:hypothetical protein